MRRPFALARRWLPCRVLLAALALAAWAAAARAGVTISTAVGGPQYGDGGSFTVTTGGSITSAGQGIIASSTSAITTLTVEGGVSAASNGFINNAASTVTTATVSGTVTGGNAGVMNAAGASIGSLLNQAGGLIRGDGLAGIEGAGTFGTIDNAGTITGPSGVSLPGATGAFVNRATGVVTGTGAGYGLFTGSTLASFTNESGGLIESVNQQGVYLYGDGVGTFDNAGTIRSLAINASSGLYVGDSVTSLTNSGTMSGFFGLEKGGAIGTLTNAATGLIQGTDTGLYVGESSLTDYVNHGRIEGGVNGVRAYFAFGPFTNKSGGVVRGDTGAGLVIEDESGTTTNEAGGIIESTDGVGLRIGGYGTSFVSGTVANAGTIRGGASGVEVTEGHLQRLANSGTIHSTGPGGGPALLVGSNGILDEIANSGSIGDGTGLAIESTAASASIGNLTNSGTINGGMTVANQNLLVHGGTGGTFGALVGGPITVQNGSLTFASGNTMLGSDVVVSSAGGTPGAGTMTNDGSLLLDGARSLTGSFTQSSGATFLSLLGVSTYGSLAATGNASFAGTLDLVQGGSSLADGQTFTLFSFAASVGDFLGLSVDGTALSSLGANEWAYGSLILTEQWTGTTMGISVRNATPIPEIDPASVTSVFALVAGAISLLERRRRA